MSWLQRTLGRGDQHADAQLPSAGPAPANTSSRLASLRGKIAKSRTRPSLLNRSK
jgi:hypothetical protein